MRAQRQRAADALAAINLHLDTLKDAMGALSAEIDNAEAAPRQERPNREASRYVSFVELLSDEAPEGWVSIEGVLAAIEKAGVKPPIRGNLKRALDGSVARGFLESSGSSYRPISDI